MGRTRRYEHQRVGFINANKQDSGLERRRGRTFRMRDPQLLHQTRWEDPTSERSPEDRLKLGIEPSDAHILKLEIRRDDRLSGSPV
jgi:hypothetical protein